MRPPRENVRRSGETYFVSSQTVDRQPFFRHERWAVLMEEIFQVMPDHFHAILSPQDSIERAMQNIKGGFSFRAKRAFDWKHNIWQAGFSDHRIRDAADFDRHISYMRHNPVKNKLCLGSEEYRYLAANLDPILQRLKPSLSVRSDGGAEAPPLQEPLPQVLSNPAKPKAPQNATVEARPLVSANRMEK